MSKTYTLPTEPDAGSRLVANSVIYTSDHWGEWRGDDGTTYDSFLELLEEVGELREMPATPRAATEFFRKYELDVMKIYASAPSGDTQKHLAELVVFAESFA